MTREGSFHCTLSPLMSLPPHAQQLGQGPILSCLWMEWCYIPSSLFRHLQYKHPCLRKGHLPTPAYSTFCSNWHHFSLCHWIQDLSHHKFPTYVSTRTLVVHPYISSHQASIIPPSACALQIGTLVPSCHPPHFSSTVPLPQAALCKSTWQKASLYCRWFQ